MSEKAAIAALAADPNVKAAAQFTKTYHKSPYEAISPERPELSQAGKTVLITGGNTGIGFAIARSFVQAKSSTVIICARRPELVSSAAATLGAEAAPGTQVIGRICDISDALAIKSLWEGFKKDGIIVDVLVTNSASFSVPKTILEAGIEQIWYDYTVNTRAILDLTGRFYKQPGDKPKFLANIASVAIHNWVAAGDRPGYGLTKNAGTLLLQLVAKDITPDKLQIVSFHPGAILTDSGKANGFDENTFPWDDTMLPGNFAVWAATPEARFLHGRFVWANWDIEELKHGSIREKIDKDPTYLQIGVNGI